MSFPCTQLSRERTMLLAWGNCSLVLRELQVGSVVAPVVVRRPEAAQPHRPSQESRRRLGSSREASFLERPKYRMTLLQAT
jgi:hypothetical protein